MPISRSNAVTRRKFRKSNVDNVDGNKIVIDGPKIVRRIAGKMIKKAASPELAGDALRKISEIDTVNHDLDQVSEFEEEADFEEVTPEVQSVTVQGTTMKPEKITISLSGDVIFTPYTDGTQYACRRDAKANLERRMPDFDILISDVTGEGQVDFTISHSFNVDDKKLALTARGIASPYEMAVHSITVDYCGQEYSVNPVDRARSPEDTVEFLKRVAVNCVNGAYR